MVKRQPEQDSEKAKDRERQARRRERLRAAKVPLTGVVDRVLVEAMAYQLASTTVSTADLGAAQVNVAEMLKTALRILVRREGYQLEGSKAALKSRLARRAEHESRTAIPSLHPDAGLSVAEIVRRRQAELESLVE